jgi:transposase-like protein
MKSKQERREIVLKALDPETNITQLAREHGITRGGVYAYLNYALDDPEGRVKEAEEEVEFRRKVWDLVR